jgi:hypothetical protein
MTDREHPKGWIPDRSDVREELQVLFDSQVNQITATTKRIEKIREGCDHVCDCRTEILAQQGLRQAARTVARILAKAV